MNTMPQRHSTLAAGKTKQWLEYAGVRSLAIILGILGIDRASRLMGWIWRKVGPRTKRQARVNSNLELAFPERSAEELAQISDAQWDNLGRTFAESFLIDRLISQSDRIQFLSEGALSNAIKGHRGFVVVSLHAGNWELTIAPVSGDFRVVGLYQQLANPLVNAFVERQRQHVFRGGLISKRRDTIKSAMQIVRNGGVVGMLSDTREKRGVNVEFFGKTVTANPFPAMIARRLKVPLFVGRSVRMDGASFAIDGLEVNIPYTDNVADDVRSAMQAINRQFEQWIKEYPGQWMWVQDRWRFAPKKRRNASA